MRRTSRAGVALVVAALVVAACGAQDEPPPAPLALDLPVVGTVGAPPPADERVTIRVTRSGHIHVPGREEALSLEGLRTWLREQAASGDALAPDGTSLKTAYLEVDAGTPWLGVQWVLQSCADLQVQIWKLSFAARTPDGATGAIGVTLPTDRGPRPTQIEAPAYHKVKVFQRDEGPASGLGVLGERLAALPKDTTGIGAVFDVVAPPPSGGRVRHEVILRLVDAVLQVGARFVSFEGAAMPREDDTFTDAEAFARHLLALRERGGAPRWKLGNGPLLPPDAAGRGKPTGQGRIEGRYGTSFDEWPSLEEIELEEVEEDDR